MYVETAQLGQLILCNTKLLLSTFVLARRCRRDARGGLLSAHTHPPRPCRALVRRLAFASARYWGVRGRFTPLFRTPVWVADWPRWHLLKRVGARRRLGCARRHLGCARHRMGVCAVVWHARHRLGRVRLGGRGLALAFEYLASGGATHLRRRARSSMLCLPLHPPAPCLRPSSVIRPYMALTWRYGMWMRWQWWWCICLGVEAPPMRVRAR